MTHRINMALRFATMLMACGLTAIEYQPLAAEAPLGPEKVRYQVDLEKANEVFIFKYGSLSAVIFGPRVPQSFGTDLPFTPMTIMESLLTDSGLSPFGGVGSSLMEFASPSPLPGEIRKFPDGIERIEDLFSVQVQVGDGVAYKAPTHLFGSHINIIPYGDGDSVKDAAGNVHCGDEVVAHYFPIGSVGFAIKHHRSSNRTLRSAGDGTGDLPKGDIKLQDTHLEIVVGVDRAGRPGVVTINNPQSYEDGGFGDEFGPGDYPMIFTTPEFPSYVPDKVLPLFMDNIRTMSVCFNTVSKFPGDYDGGDPLSARTPEQIRHQVKMMIKAVAGDAEAKAFFERKENQMYCAELAFIATSAGLLVPLNQEYVLKLGITKAEWEIFKHQLSLHNQHQSLRPSYFVRNNANPKLALVQLADPDKLGTLQPLPEYSPNPQLESQKLAFKPMTMTDIVDGFMRLHFPRQEIGERIAPFQAKILSQMKPGLFKMLDTDPASQAAVPINRLFDEIVAVVGKEHENYAAFRAALTPLLQKARSMSEGLGESQGLFTPPSLFHQVLLGMNTSDGLITLKYLGHGLHFSMLRPQ